MIETETSNSTNGPESNEGAAQANGQGGANTQGAARRRGTHHGNSGYEIVVEEGRDPFRLFDSFREIWRYRGLIRELVRRDLKVRYKGSPVGIGWSLVNPLLQIFGITVVVKLMSSSPPKDYSAYLFIIFLWTFFQISLLDCGASVITNAALVRKVYFPRAIFPIISIINNLFHFGISLGFTVLYFFMLGTYPGLLRPHFLLVIPVVFFMATLALGLGLMLACLTVFYADVTFMVTTLLGLSLYALPVFYQIERVAANPFLYSIYMLNPVAALLVTYQRALLPPRPVLISPAVVLDATHTLPARVLPALDVPWPYFFLACFSSTLVLVVGFLVFERKQWEMAERL